jgi:AbrB family looped-hinge helix DNA binding protein
MPLVKVGRSAQITLPVEIRKPLNIAEGDYLMAEVVEGGILLKPVSVVEREESWKQLFELLDQVPRGSPHKKFKNARQEEEEIAEMVKDARKQG